MIFIDLGWCIGRLDKQGEKLVIISPSAEQEHSYVPAESICLYGKSNLIALRDALLEAYPLEPKGAA